MVTLRNGVDLINVQTPREALDHMLSIVRHSDTDASKVADAVGFSGLSVRETVETYAAFKHATLDAEVIEFSSCGKQRLWKEVA